MKTFLVSLIICIASACTVPVKSLSDCQLDVSRSGKVSVMTCKNHEPIELPGFDPAFEKCVRDSEKTPAPNPDAPDTVTPDVDNGEN